MKGVDLVVVGNLLLDDLPHGSNVPGGAALFTALAARCCGLSVAVHSVVGNDYPLHWLEEAGVHLSLTVLEGPGGRTVIRYTPAGRTLQHVGPCHRQLSPQQPHPFRAGLVHVAPMPTDIQALHLRSCPPRGALLDPYPGLDPATWSVFDGLQDRLAALLLNEEEVQMDLGVLSSDLWAVLKQGPRGGVTFNPALSWPAVPCTVLDPTGAGDAFAAGLAAGLLQNGDRAAALARGAEAASWVLQGLGADALYRRATVQRAGSTCSSLESPAP